MLGNEVATLVDEFKTSGRKSIIWDGTDNSGKEVGSGVYLYRIQTEIHSQSKKMLFLK